MSYQVFVSPAAVRTRIDRAILGLAEDPRPPGARKLAGATSLWRIRVGRWRILYTIEDARLVVLVVAVGHRRQVYRDL
jgi:mRNA interferase RelE/StbE